MARAEQKQYQSEDEQQQSTKPLPKCVVLGPDGKPCRTCTSTSSWQNMMKATTTTSSSSSSSSSSKPTVPTSSASSDCPPDVEQLGRSSWTLLHSITAQYPEKPSFTQQVETKQFLGLFGKMYPCWVCAEDFQTWMQRDGNEPRLSNREEFGRWMCEAHNAVNEKLGKQRFDCERWEERWRTGWRDGRCG